MSKFKFIAHETPMSKSGKSARGSVYTNPPFPVKPSFIAFCYLQVTEEVPSGWSVAFDEYKMDPLLVLDANGDPTDEVRVYSDGTPMQGLTITAW